MIDRTINQLDMAILKVCEDKTWLTVDRINSLVKRHIDTVKDDDGDDVVPISRELVAIRCGALLNANKLSHTVFEEYSCTPQYLFKGLPKEN